MRKRGVVRPRFVGSHRNDLDTAPDGPKGNFDHWKRFSGMRFAGYERCYLLVYNRQQTQLEENFAHVNPNGVYDPGPLNFKDSGNFFIGGTDVPYRFNTSVVPPLGWGNSVRYWVNWGDVDTNAIRTAILNERPDVLTRIQNARIKYWLVDNQPEWYTAIHQWRSSLNDYNSTYSYAVQHMNIVVQLLKSIHDVPVFANVYNGYTGFSAALACFDGILFESFYWRHTAGIGSADTYDEATARVFGEPFRLTARRVLEARRKRKLLMFRVPQLRRTDVPLAFRLFRTFPNALFCEHRYIPTGRHISPSSLFSREGAYVQPPQI